ncbi:hypothetical protein [Bacillus thuringiensis]|uniref:hypothetical protein n=1 Tax=Bacillus thuringiensis TaxID=1428 RepID=UPI003C308457
MKISSGVWEAKQQADQKVYSILHDGLVQEQKDQLDALLFSISMAKRCTGPAFTRIIFKSQKIGLTIDTTKINTNRLRQLARLGSKYEPYAFRRCF